MATNTKVLILEDLQSDVILIKRELNKALSGLQTKVVDNESDFLKALEEFQPDLIISDYSMPAFDGMSALKLTLKKAPLTPFILCTGSMNEETAVECMKIGATDYVIKEHISRLGQAARHALGEKEIKLEKIRAESELRESEEKYRLIVENANDGIEITQNDRIIFCNTRFAEMLGYTVDELQNVSFSQIFTEEATRELQQRQQLRRAGKRVSPQYESTFRKKDGTIIDVAVNHEIIDYHGQPATFAIIRDITEHKQNENLKDLQYKIARAAVEAKNATEFHEIIWSPLSELMDMENFYVAFYDEKSKRFSAAFEKDEKDQIPEWSADKSMTGQVIKQQKSLLLKKADIIGLADKGEIELIGSVPEVWLGVPFWSGGKPAGALVSQNYDDPNALRQYELEILEMLSGEFGKFLEISSARNALRDSEATLQAVLQSTADGILAIGKADNVLYANDHFAEMWRIPTALMESRNDSLLLQYVIDQLTDPEGFLEKVRKLYDSDEESFDTIFFKDGRVFERLSRPLLKEEELWGRVWSFRDITERKRAEEALRESEARFRSLYENATMGLYRTTQDGKILLANPTLVNMLGYSSFEELRSRNLEEEGFEPSYPRAKFIELIEKEGEIKGFESTWKRQDGSIISIRESARAIRDPNGKTLYYDGTVEDITERKRAEERILINQTRLRSLVNILQHKTTDLQEFLDYALNEAISLTDSKIGYIYFYNDKTKEFTLNSWSKGVMEECSVVNPQTVYQLEKTGLWGEAVRQGKEIVVNDFKEPNPLKKGYPEGHVALYKFLTIPVFSNERIVAVVGVANKETDYNQDDVLQLQLLMDNVWKEVERRRSAHLLEKSESRFRNIMASMQDIVFTLDTEQRHTGVYGPWVEQQGKTPEDFLGKTAREILGDDAAEIHETANAKALTGEFVVYEWSVPAEDGTQYFQTSLSPIRDGAGNIQGLVGIGRNITELKQAEDAIEEMLDRWQTTFDAISDIVCVVSKDFEFEAMNSAGIKSLGLSREEIIGRKCFELVHKTNSPIAVCPCQKSLNTGEPGIGELEQDGRYYMLYAWPVRDQAGNIKSFVHIVKDITEEKQMEAEKETLEAQLHQSQKLESVGTLASGVAHDFNNLLTVILGNAQMGVMQTSEGEPMNRFLKQIVKASNRAADLTRQLLLFSRKQTMEFKPVNLNRTIQNLLKMLGRLIGENIEIEIVLEPSLWTVDADEGNIEQVLTNLAVNARDAMPDGGKLVIQTENVQITEADKNYILNAEAGNYVRIGIIDNGMGIPDEIRDKIFDPFFTTKASGRGTGLGLSVVYGIVKKHGGWINVSSEVGKGTRFTIYLPATGKMAQSGEKEAVPDLESLQGNGERILLIEDEESVLEFTLNSLRQYEYKVFPVSTGKEAHTVFERESGKFDLIFSDVILPDTNGYELVKSLTGGKLDIPIILSSGYTDARVREQIGQEPSITFIQKPYSIVKMLEMVKIALQKSQIN